VLSGSLVAGDSTVGVAAGAHAESITAIKTRIPIQLKIVLRNMFFLLMYFERM
jgi:hypothetical protein